MGSVRAWTVNIINHHCSGCCCTILFLCSRPLVTSSCFYSGSNNNNNKADLCGVAFGSTSGVCVCRGGYRSCVPPKFIENVNLGSQIHCFTIQQMT